uniref:Uncharacterized protein n=1 Tax=Candidatus Kentrum sp. FW TaxID=2126338 RepID=A0A450T5J9_9GAMM|nr:MAG: hypothetical protein BECKFW1821A_GA0114235_11209 [Candidatus Kentron sp. FW]
MIRTSSGTLPVSKKSSHDCFSSIYPLVFARWKQMAMSDGTGDPDGRGSECFYCVFRPETACFQPYCKGFGDHGFTQRGCPCFRNPTRRNIMVLSPFMTGKGSAPHMGKLEDRILPDPRISGETSHRHRRNPVSHPSAASALFALSNASQFPLYPIRRIFRFAFHLFTFFSRNFQFPSMRPDVGHIVHGNHNPMALA